MSIHRWVEDHEKTLGIMVAFDEEPTEETIAAFEELANWIATPEGRAALKAHMGPGIPISEAEAAEDGDRQMSRISDLRRRAGLDT